MTVIQGQWQVKDSPRIGIVVSQFNQNISEALLEGCLSTLTRLGVSNDSLDVIWVPGAFEIPGTVKQILDRYDAVITLGAVIRGETPHFEYVAGAVAAGIADLARTGPIPIIFGVLTTNTTEEARDRSGGKSGNKGSDGALAALEMISLYQKLSGA